MLGREVGGCVLRSITQAWVCQDKIRGEIADVGAECNGDGWLSMTSAVLCFAKHSHPLRRSLCERNALAEHRKAWERRLGGSFVGHVLDEAIDDLLEERSCSGAVVVVRRATLISMNAKLHVDRHFA